MLMALAPAKPSAKSEIPAGRQKVQRSVAPPSVVEMVLKSCENSPLIPAESHRKGEYWTAPFAPAKEFQIQKNTNGTNPTNGF